MDIPSVSSKHAKVIVKGSAFKVVDLGSTNGTYINDEEIDPNKEQDVKVSDALVFGDTHLAKFRLVEEKE